MSNSLSGLRARLILLVLTAMVPAFALIIDSAGKYRELTATQVKQNLVIAARAVAAEQDRVLENAHEFLVTLSRVPQLREQDRSACGRILAGLLDPRFADLVLSDRSGNPICTALPRNHSIAAATGRHYSRTIETYDFAVGNVRQHSNSARTLLDVSYPVLNGPGVVKAVVSAAIDLSWTNRVAVDTHLQPGATFTLLDSNGEVLLRYPDGKQWIGKTFFNAAPLSPPKGNDPTLEIESRDGITRLVAVSALRNPVGGTMVYAAVDLPLEKAFSKSREILLKQLIALGVLAVLILVSTWFGTDALVLRRIRDIIAATREMAAGNLRARTTLAYDASELGQMARSFDHLAEALEQRETEATQAAKQIHQQRRQQEALYDLNRGITSTLDIGNVLSILLDHISFLFTSHLITVSWIDSHTQKLETIARRGGTSSAADLTAEQTLPLVVLERQSAVAILETRCDRHDRELLGQDGWASYLGLPLQVKTDVLGVLSFYSRDNYEFTEEEINFLNTLVNQAAVAIHNSQLFEQTRQQAVALEKSNKIKDEFLGVMSHELRTPLNIIMNYSEALRMGTFGEIEPDQIRGIDKIRLQAGHLLSLINGILEITKIESGTVFVDKHQVDLNEFMAELKTDYILPSENDVSLVWQESRDLPILVTDRVKLRQIVTNLINNALKFTAQGSVTVFAAVSDKGDTFDIQVADTGPGIPRELLPFVFDKFRQIDSATTRNYSGAGLGLYIVKNFVALLGGTIEVRSDLGAGSTFTVTFPIAKPAAQVNQAASTADSNDAAIAS